MHAIFATWVNHGCSSIYFSARKSVNGSGSSFGWFCRCLCVSSLKCRSVSYRTRLLAWVLNTFRQQHLQVAGASVMPCAARCCTSSKVPAAGFVALTPPFTISSTGSDDARLPSSHTCYNQLEIPQYSSAEILRDKLLRALEFGAIGFGFA